MSDRHPNTVPCARCYEDKAPRYGAGFNGKASPHCEDCQPIVADELHAERARQREAKCNGHV